MKNILRQVIVFVLVWQSRIILKRFNPKVVAITGSLGKTGTKDAVAEALKVKYTVRKSPKSFNSEFGIPLTILGLPNAWNNPFLWIVNIFRGFFKALFKTGYEDVLVIEVGADKPGDIENVSSWLKTDIVIITAVPDVPVHVEFYPSSKEVLLEKSKLIKSLKEGGVLITGVDKNVSSLTNPKGRVIRVAYDNAEIVYENDMPSGMRFEIKDHIINAKGVLGAHQGLSHAFALTVAELLGVNVSDAVGELENMNRTPGRMRLLEGKNGSVIIDDSYNSSPDALRAAIDTLKDVKCYGRKIAILGDMRELGEHEKSEHEKAGAHVAKVADFLYTVGPKARHIASSAIDSGMNAECVFCYDTEEASRAGKDLADKLRKRDIVLVKSSQGNLRLEKAVKELMLCPDRAKQLLVRQDEQWLKR